MTSSRVAITGIGLLTPLGPDRESSWQGICEGKRAARRLWADELRVKRGEESSGGRVSAGDPSVAPLSRFEAVGAPVQWPRTGANSRLAGFALKVAQEAVEQCGAWSIVPPHRRGVVIGTSKTDLYAVGTVPEALLVSHPCDAVARAFDCQGPSLAPVAACATGLVSLIRAAELIRRGDCDVVLAGSVDASLHPAVLGSYRRLGVLAKPGDDPALACRPFDRSRSGFVIGEGGAALVLERWESAVARGRPLAEWVGGTYGSDPSGITQVDCSGESIAELIGRTLDRFGLRPGEVDVASLHGTATRQNDVAESRGLLRAFGGAGRRPACFSVKGGMGHLLGAAGAVEAAITTMVLRDGVIPPTVNLFDPDPQCPLDFVVEKARLRDVRCALKLSLGFGGHLAAAVIKRAET